MITKKPSGYWKTGKVAISEARKVMRKHGFRRLPNTKYLNEMGYSGLTYAIETHYGGMTFFRQILGYKGFVGGVDTHHGGIRKLRDILGQKQPILEQGKMEGC